MVAPFRFELKFQDPESRMIDHYTTELSRALLLHCFNIFGWKDGDKGKFGCMIQNIRDISPGRKKFN